MKKLGVRVAPSAETLLKHADRELSFAKARAQILSTAPCVHRETLALAQAAGRVLAAPVCARRDNPAGAVSADCRGRCVGHTRIPNRRRSKNSFTWVRTSGRSDLGTRWLR